MTLQQGMFNGLEMAILQLLHLSLSWRPMNDLSEAFIVTQ